MYKRTMVVKYININSKLNFKPNVACIGYFDGVHIGHQKLILETIKEAKKLNIASTIICFSPDPNDIIYGTKNRHLTRLKDRLSIFENLGIDNVVVFRFNNDFMRITPTKFIINYLNKMNITKLICGYDFHFGYKGKGDCRLLKEKGDFSLKVVPECKYRGIKVSSTRIKESLSKGDFRLVYKLLGYNYHLMLKVKKSSKIGKKWLIELISSYKDSILPIDGVYSSGFEVRRNSVFIYGPKPLKVGQAVLLEFSAYE